MNETMDEIQPLLDPRAIAITENRGPTHSTLKATLSVQDMVPIDTLEERTNPAIRAHAEAYLRARIWAELYKPVMDRVHELRAMILHRCDLTDEPRYCDMLEKYREITEELLILLSPPGEQVQP